MERPEEFWHFFENLMNAQEESLISAYLDGELDTPRRLTVEAALLADPKLAERLQELSCVRGLVSNLPRPTVSYDVSGQVLASIDNLPQVRLRRFVRSSVRSPRRLGLVAGLAAAVVMVVAIPMNWHKTKADNELREVDSVPVVSVPKNETNPRPVPPTFPVEAISHPEAPLVAVAPKPSISPDPLLVPSAADRRSGKDREALTEVLDKPGVRRLLLYVDSLDSRTLNHVESALQKTHRTHPFRARQRVAQSIVIDPSRPSEAVVYTVVLTEPELEALESNLDDSLHLEGDDQPDPELLTRLSEAGDLQVWDSPARTEPERMHATRSAPEPVAPSLGHVVDLDPGETAGSPLRVHPRTVFKERTPKKSAPRPTPKSPEEKGTVYLVWVTTRPRS